MTLSTRKAPRNVEAHGAGYRVVIRWNGAKYVETGFATEDDADERAIALRRMKKKGDPAPSAGAELTLRDVLDAWLVDRPGTRAGRNGDPLRERSLTRERSDVKALLRYLDGDLPLRKVTRAMVNVAIRDRAKATTKSAQGELANLKRALRHAEETHEYGLGIDHGIYSIAAPRVVRRERRALTERVASRLDGRIDRRGAGVLALADLPRFLRMTGLRIGEALALRETDFVDDPTGCYLRIRENKEGNTDKRVPVVRGEVRQMVRRGMRLRDASSTPRFLFADDDGRQLTYSVAYQLFQRARRAAEREWSREHPTADPLDNPFVDLTPHDMRSTFATIMRDAGASKESVAFVLGHADVKVLDRVYDKSDREARALRELARFGDAADAAERSQTIGSASATGTA